MFKTELSEFPLMSCLNDAEMEFVSQHSKDTILKKSQLLYQAGDMSEALFFLMDGVVKITTKTLDGREVIKTILHPGAILGELSLADEGNRKNNAVVLSPNARILEVKAAIFKQMMEQNTKLAFCVINFIANKLIYVEERFESIALNNARERIIDFLKTNAMLSGQNIGLETLLKHDFTQQDIADYTATTRQTVTTVLNELRKTNKILFKRKNILIRDVINLG